MADDKADRRGQFEITSLPVVEPPIPDSGGRLLSDSAGEMAAIINGRMVRFAAYIEFLPGGRARGNHVHRIKTEYLYIMTGRLRATYLNTLTGESTTREVVAGDLITVFPDCAHVYEPLERSQALELTPQVFDPADTVRYQVVG